MSEVKRYGTTQVEDDAEWTLQCRQIVRVINDFGVTDKQRLKIIYLLGLELEDRDQLQEITGLIKRLEAGERKSSLITDI
jgi:hypothetical protein